MTFKEFGFEEALTEALYFMKFEEATPIQEQAIPEILAGKDLIACAQTGTGKTAAFLLPLIDKQSKGLLPEESVHTLVIVPTRELALQIDQQLEAFSYFSGASSIAIYGGGNAPGFDQQKKALKKGAGFIIATPGRLIAHMQLGYVDFSKVKHLVLDEADRMLDMGFQEDIEQIAQHLPKVRQTLLFSATMPNRIRKLAQNTLKDPVTINIAISKPAEGVLQGAYVVYEGQKMELLKNLLAGKKNYPSILVFTSTRRNCTEIARELRKADFQAQEISSDLEQSDRERVLREFAARKIQILVATDILARGIDIENINLVINYEVPNDAEDYVHRVGRTARADKTGVALTLIGERQQRDFRQIEELIGEEIMKMPLPPEIGEGPAYQPEKRGGRGGRRGGGGRKHSSSRRKKGKGRRSSNNSGKRKNRKSS